MTSKACQLLHQYLLNDLVKMVEAFIPEHILCEQLIDMVTDGRVIMDLQPGANRIGFKEFTTNPIKLPGPTYSTPLDCILYTRAAKTKDSKDLGIIMNKLDQIDDIQVVQTLNHWGVACDTKSMIYQHLYHHGLIEKAVPQWYKEDSKNQYWLK